MASTGKIPESGTEGVGERGGAFTVVSPGETGAVVVTGAMLVCDTAGRTPDSTDEIVKRLDNSLISFGERFAQIEII